MKGQHFIVTGGTSGLGLSIVRKLLENKVHVTLLVRDVDKATRIFEQELGKTINVIPCDLNDLKSIQALQFEDNTSFDGFIYSAGLGYFKSISDHSFSEMIETYQLNLISFNVLYTVLRPYLTSNAHIVGISSQAAFSTQANAAHYGASKAGFYALMNALRLESPNLHIMTVNVGPIDTPFHQKADPSMKYAKKMGEIMLDANQLAEDIIYGIKTKQLEINRPKWMHHALKMYQIAPRFFERCFPKLFKNKAYTGATASNFLLNGVAGTLIVANTFVQRGLGYSSLQAGSLSITYLVMVLIMIRVGEKLLQTLGCKKPMLIGTGVLIVGECLISLTFLPEIFYVICCIIGYLFFGLGLGIYATPSTDTAIANAPLEKVGVAAGIYKMASALGGAFGVALSGAVYAIVSNMTNIYTGAMIALWLNAGMGILSFVIILLLVPKQNDTQL
ncbi:SDR family NAD(P)-dependent oxidoreductase [Staphylococcus aureus]